MTSTGRAAGIAYQDSGPDQTGRPLLLIHGAGGTGRHWPDSLRRLPDRRVITVDLPGHGRSPGPPERSVAASARRVAALLEALAIPTVVVAGHSMGGAIALTLALEAPARVAGLILVATGARLRVTFVEGFLANAPGVVHADHAGCDRFDVMARLGEVAAPTLVVCGDQDRLTPPKYSDHLHAAIRGARQVRIPGAGHMVMLEAEAPVAGAVGAFLGSLG